MENREDLLQYQKLYKKDHEEEIKEKSKKRYQENKGEIKIYGIGYRIKNKEKIIKDKKEYNKKIKIEALKILGGCKCAICGDANLGHLTIDHIDKTGNLDKREGLYAQKLYSSIVKGTYPKEKLSNLRVLCWDHNAGRQKKYLDLSFEEQTQNNNTKLNYGKKLITFLVRVSVGKKI